MLVCAVLGSNLPLTVPQFPWVGTTVSSFKQRVALQTALAAVEGKRKGKLRVLFDKGSQRTFVSMKAVKRLDLKPIRQENLSIKVIGRSEAETALRYHGRSLRYH